MSRPSVKVARPLTSIKRSPASTVHGSHPRTYLVNTVPRRARTPIFVSDIQLQSSCSGGAPILLFGRSAPGQSTDQLMFREGCKRGVWVSRENAQRA
jgi:hypothetical protein